MYRVNMEFGLAERVDLVRALFHDVGVGGLFERYVRPFVEGGDMYTDWFATAVELAMDKKCLPGIEIMRNGLETWTWCLNVDREPWLTPQGWTPEPAAVNSVKTLHINGNHHYITMAIGCWSAHQTPLGNVINFTTHSIQASFGPNLFLKDLRITAFDHEESSPLKLFFAEECLLCLENVKVLAPGGSVQQCFPSGDDIHLTSFTVDEYWPEL